MLELLLEAIEMNRAYDLLLKDKEQQEQGTQNNEGRSHHQVPLRSMHRLKGRDPDCEDAQVVRVSDDERPEEVVPGLYERNDSQRCQDGTTQRENDEAQDL